MDFKILGITRVLSKGKTFTAVGNADAQTC